MIKKYIITCILLFKISIYAQHNICKVINLSIINSHDTFYKGYFKIDSFYKNNRIYGNENDWYYSIRYYAKYDFNSNRINFSIDDANTLSNLISTKFPKLEYIIFNTNSLFDSIVIKSFQLMLKNNYQIILGLGDNRNYVGAEELLNLKSERVSDLGQYDNTMIGFSIKYNTDQYGGNEKLDLLKKSILQKEYLSELGDTVYIVQTNSQILINNKCEYFNLDLLSAEQYSSLEIENKDPLENKDKYLYYKININSIKLTGDENSLLRQLTITKPIWNCELELNHNLTTSLKEFRLETVYTSFFPKKIYKCKNLNALSINLFGIDNQFVELDSFNKLKTLELFNCAKINKKQQEILLKSNVLKELTHLTLTYPPDVRFLLKFLKKCSKLKSFYTDENTLDMIAQYSKNKVPKISKDWDKVLSTFQLISVNTYKFHFDSIVYQDWEIHDFIGNLNFFTNKYFEVEPSSYDYKNPKCIFYFKHEYEKYQKKSKSTDLMNTINQTESNKIELFDFYRKKYSSFKIIAT